jgi:hypothetical protein
MSTLTAPEGYTVCRTSTRFEVINDGDTCVWNDMHLRKVSAAHAVEVGAPADRQGQYFVGHRTEVWQTFGQSAATSNVASKPATPEGYNVDSSPIEYSCLNVGDTFINGVQHMIKRDDHHAGIIGYENSGTYTVSVGRRVWQTFKHADLSWATPVSVSEISEPTPQFEPGDSIRLAILPRIDHEAEIISHDGENRWHVAAKVNGQRFDFIVFEHQIVKMQRYLVTGLSRLGVADGGEFAFTPQSAIVEAHTAVEARKLAKALHNDYYQIVTCMLMPATHFEPEYYDDEGVVAFY